VKKEKKGEILSSAGEQIDTLEKKREGSPFLAGGKKKGKTPASYLTSEGKGT